MLELAHFNPVEAKRIYEGSTCTEISVAWMAYKRTQRGVGYTVS